MNNVLTNVRHILAAPLTSGGHCKDANTLPHLTPPLSTITASLFGARRLHFGLGSQKQGIINCTTF